MNEEHYVKAIIKKDKQNFAILNLFIGFVVLGIVGISFYNGEYLRGGVILLMAGAAVIDLYYREFRKVKKDKGLVKTYKLNWIELLGQVLYTFVMVVFIPAIAFGILYVVVCLVFNIPAKLFLVFFGLIYATWLLTILVKVANTVLGIIINNRNSTLIIKSMYKSTILQRSQIKSVSVEVRDRSFFDSLVVDSVTNMKLQFIVIKTEQENILLNINEQIFDKPISQMLDDLNEFVGVKINANIEGELNLLAEEKMDCSFLSEEELRRL